MEKKRECTPATLSQPRFAKFRHTQVMLKSEAPTQALTLCPPL